MNASKISIILLALWLVFVGAVWATWINVTSHNLGILSVIVGIVVVAIEVLVEWKPWVRK